MSPDPELFAHGKTREEISIDAAENAAEVSDKLNDILAKCNDIFEQLDGEPLESLSPTKVVKKKVAVKKKEK